MKKVVYRRKKVQDGDEKERKGGTSAKVILYSIVVTAVLYVLLIFVEKTLVNVDDRKEVYVTVKEVPADVEISVINLDEYFKLEERPVSVIPDGSITQSEELVGCITDRAILKNEIVTHTSLSTQDERTKDIAHPIEVSLNASNLAQVVGGVLRTGDYINIWSVKSNNVNGETVTVTKNICSHAYVTRSFSSTGEAAQEGDTDMATMIINVIIPAEMEEEFNTAIVGGTLRVGRYLYDYDGADMEKEPADDEKPDAAVSDDKSGGTDKAGDNVQEPEEDVTEPEEDTADAVTEDAAVSDGM